MEMSYHRCAKDYEISMSNTTLQSGYLTDRYAEPLREMPAIEAAHHHIYPCAR